MAYLRFASVYRAFESADDFIKEIADMHADAATAAARDAATTQPVPTG